MHLLTFNYLNATTLVGIECGVDSENYTLLAQSSFSGPGDIVFSLYFRFLCVWKGDLAVFLKASYLVLIQELAKCVLFSYFSRLKKAVAHTRKWTLLWKQSLHTKCCPSFMKLRPDQEGTKERHLRVLGLQPRRHSPQKHYIHVSVCLWRERAYIYNWKAKELTFRFTMQIDFQV